MKILESLEYCIYFYFFRSRATIDRPPPSAHDLRCTTRGFVLFNWFLFSFAVYVVLGNYYDHTGLVVAMDEMDLFKNGMWDEFGKYRFPTTTSVPNRLTTRRSA